MYILKLSGCTGNPYLLLIGMQRIQFFIPGARFLMKSRMPGIPSSDGGVQLADPSQDGIVSCIGPMSGRSVTIRTEDTASIRSYQRLRCIMLKAPSGQNQGVQHQGGGWRCRPV